MKISELILSGNLLEAKRAITDRLNEAALHILDETKKAYAAVLFTEEFDAKPKEKTDMDFVKDAKAEGEDVGDDVPDKAPEEEAPEEAPEDDAEADVKKKVEAKKDTDGDGDDDKNITVNIKEEQNGGNNGAPGSAAFKKYTKGLNKKGPNKTKTQTTAVVKEGVIPVAKGKASQESPGKGAAESPKWKSVQKALMKKAGAGVKTKTTAVIGESAEDIQELKKSTLGSYIKKAANEVSSNSYKAGKVMWKGDKNFGKDYEKHTEKSVQRQKGIFKATQKLVDGKHDK